jgi:hypothetical protein
MRATIRLRLVRALGCSLALALALVLPGCGEGLPSADSSTSDASTGWPMASISSTSTSTTVSADDTRGTASVDETGVVFLLDPDAGGSAFECDIFEQHCPKGEKCTMWANDGGTWNASKCVPVVDDPAGAGEPCHMEGGPASGIDDCDLGMMCWDVDSKTLEGTCIPFCVGDSSNPECEDPGRFCATGGVLAVCLQICNPLVQDCGEGRACYPTQGEFWSCAPDASGEEGAYGDYCAFINSCDPGLICIESSTVPPGQPCEGTGGCCTEVCDLADPLGDLQCAGAAEGQTCQAWYQEGKAPAGLENVGACALPQ